MAHPPDSAEPGSDWEKFAAVSVHRRLTAISPERWLKIWRGWPINALCLSRIEKAASACGRRAAGPLGLLRTGNPYQENAQ